MPYEIICDRSLAVTVITVEEQLRGWFKVIKRHSSDSKLIWAYAGLRGAVEYFNKIPNCKCIGMSDEWLGIV